MNSKLIIRRLLITSSIILVVLGSKAQPASERPIPKKSEWMKKVEQNRALAKKQVSGHGGNVIMPAFAKSQNNLSQPSIQSSLATPASRPAAARVIQQQPASGQKMQIPPKPKVKDEAVQKNAQQ